MKTLDVEYVRECLSYNPMSGEFIWKVRPETHFKNRAYGYLAWNARNAGKVAGKYDKHGYRMIGVNHEFFFAHRLAWAIHYGEWPQYIDHINGVHDDNRIDNLRSVSHQENSQNRARWSKNKSGVIGVSWSATTQKWRATLGNSSKKESHIGSFKTFEEAVTARYWAEKYSGYHPNHGRAK